MQYLISLVSIITRYYYKREMQKNRIYVYSVERITAFEAALRCTRNPAQRYKVYIEPLNHGNNIVERAQKASRRRGGRHFKK